MITTRFHVDNFKPWNAPYGKSRAPLQKIPDQARLSTRPFAKDLPLTPIPSLHSSPQPCAQPQNHQQQQHQRQHYHPLPPRPPAEVCAYSNTRSSVSQGPEPSGSLDGSSSPSYEVNGESYSLIPSRQATTGSDPGTEPDFRSAIQTATHEDSSEALTGIYISRIQSTIERLAAKRSD